MKKVLFAVTVVFTMCLSLTLIAQEKKDAPTIFNDMVKNVESLKSYSLTFEYENVSGKKKEWRICDFMFKTRDFMRLEVKDGDDKGGKVAFNAPISKDKVAVKKGFIKVNLSVDDERMQGFFESDMNSDAKELVELTKGGTFTLDGNEKVADRDTAKITIKTKSDKYDKIELWIDEKDNLLIKYKYYEKGKYHSSKTYSNINLKADLKDEDFKP